jgi:hypothetical protein
MNSDARGAQLSRPIRAGDIAIIEFCVPSVTTRAVH